MKYSTVNFLHVSKFTAPDDDVAITLLYARSEFVAEVSDRHEPVLCVVALVPTFLDRGTILCALPSESVTTPGHVPILKYDSHHSLFFRRRRAIMAVLQGFACFKRL